MVYDSWGKLVSIIDPSQDNLDVTSNINHIGYINPLRYRGYYYDSETNPYYLNARYYDPQTCRFINSDNNLEGGLNLFEYCHNNPVMFSDCDGQNPWDRFDTLWDAYWNAAVYLQNETLMDPVGHERATIIIKRQDPVTGNDYYTYPDPEVGVNDQSVDPTPLIRNYLHESPDRLFLHTHGKYDPRFESNHFSEIGDLSASDHYK